MTYPTPRQLQAWADTLTAVDYRDLTRRLQVAIERDRNGGSNQPDGYPASTRGGYGSTAELTPTEAAANARAGDHIDGQWTTRDRDEHAHLTRNAVDYLQQALLSVQACNQTLAKMEAASRPLDVDDDQWCRACLTDAGYRQPVAHGRYARYCVWCGEFYAAYGCEPPLTILQARHQGRRIYDRDIEQALGPNRGRRVG